MANPPSQTAHTVHRGLPKSLARVSGFELLVAQWVVLCKPYEDLRLVNTPASGPWRKFTAMVLVAPTTTAVR